MDQPRASNIARSQAERLLAWGYTGPLGHLYSALADIAVMWTRHISAQLKASRSRQRT